MARPGPGGMHPGLQVDSEGDIRPVPDPTVLTTQQLGSAINSQRDLFETRLDAMDKAISLLQSVANRTPTIGEVFVKFEERFKSVDNYFQQNDSIQKERFIRIDQSFVERDKRTDQLTLASSTAIAAALQAQKEAAGETQKSSSAAIAKSEASTSESIKQLQTLFQTSIGGLSSQIADVKSRLDKGEGQGVIRREQLTDDRYGSTERRAIDTDKRGELFGLVGIVIAIGAVIATIIIHH